ncbi:hypothetical protein JCM19238_2099 [Vibrio ponticus]|nr:hypothetical protein JCM19238_2099 [Vibrio ponticus]
MDEYFETPAEHRMSMKILKDANVLPPAVQLMQKIEQKKLEREQTTDPDRNEALRKEIMKLELNRDLLLKRQ